MVYSRMKSCQKNGNKNLVNIQKKLMSSDQQIPVHQDLSIRHKEFT